MLKKVLTIIIVTGIGLAVVIPLTLSFLTMPDPPSSMPSKQQTINQIPFVMGKVAGVDDRKSKKKEYYNAQEKYEEMGLNEIYEQVKRYDDTRKHLYENEDFALVTERMTTYFDAMTSPLEEYYYTGHINHLGSIKYSEDPKHQLKILGRWVEASKDSHLPYLIRGLVHIDYAWIFRGQRYAGNVTEKGWKKFHEHLELAKQDLDKAHELAPDNPEASTSLITVASALDMSSSAVNAYYQRALDINPLHYSARSTMLHFAQPKWGGSWETMEALEKDCEKYTDESPMLEFVIWTSRKNMVVRGEEYYQDFIQSQERYLNAALKLLETKPDDIHLNTKAAYFATTAHEYVIAAHHFGVIGDRFLGASDFENVEHYSTSRGMALLFCSQEPNVKGTDNERILLEKAILYAPSSPFTVGQYVHFLTTESEPEKLAQYAQKYKDITNKKHPSLQ